jgi:hypothetical protein
MNINCVCCNVIFVTNICNTKYCSRNCYQLAKSRRLNEKRKNIFITVNCIECGWQFQYSKNIGHEIKFCSKKCISFYNSRVSKKFLDIPSCLENSSRKIDKTLGYVRIYVPMHTEANTWGYVYEHRIVAEQIIGRRLNKEEIVHHKNGKRWDNRLENLEVMNKNDHAKLHGQRENDLDI